MFVCTGTCPGLETVSPGLLNDHADAEEEADDREARTYKCWLASLGVQTESSDLLEDCTSGLPLLRIMDKLWPGCVDWKKRANARPRNVHERVENCNYALEIAQAQGMKVVGIGGKDIADGSTKLTLALLWQAQTSKPIVGKAHTRPHVHAHVHVHAHAHAHAHAHVYLYAHAYAHVHVHVHAHVVHICA